MNFKEPHALQGYCVIIAHLHTHVHQDRVLAKAGESREDVCPLSHLHYDAVDGMQ